LALGNLQGKENLTRRCLATYVKWDSLENLEDIIVVGGYSELTGNRLKWFNEHQGRFTVYNNEGAGENREIPCGDAFTDPRTRTKPRPLFD